MIAPSPPFSLLRTEIAGIPVADLVRELGTPIFVYDAAPILRRIGDLAAFDCVRYAQKACSNLGILDLIRRQGVLVDATSAGEIARALAAGFPVFPVQGEPPPIVYTADIFDREALELVTEHGIHVNCGSPDMIDQLGERVPGAEITLRINPGFGHGHSRKTNTGGEHSKHGIWHEDLDAALDRAAANSLTVTGLHVHIGSGSDLHHLSRVAAEMERFARQVGPSVTSISAGGGLPVPYRVGEVYVDLDAYFAVWDRVRRRLEESFGHPVRLEIEPGRYLVAESGYLVTEIRAIKRMGTNTFYLVDAGFNNLARPVLYGAYHPMSIVPRSREPGETGEERPIQEVVVGGQLCESGDIFTQDEGGSVATRALPVAEVGEYLVMESAGAYGFVMSSNYNSKPFAAEVLIRDGQAHLVRARQTLADLLRGEVLPPLG
jgi:diaminopimelate decarboxylase